MESYTMEDISVILRENVDAVLLVDASINKYRTISKHGFLDTFIADEGEYNELIEKLWIHLGNSNEKISKDYTVFVSYYGDFKGKYSRRLKIKLDGEESPHVVQMTVYPLKEKDKYVFVMDELDDDEYISFFNVCGSGEGYHQQHKYYRDFGGYI